MPAPSSFRTPRTDSSLPPGGSTSLSWDRPSTGRRGAVGLGGVTWSVDERAACPVLVLSHDTGPIDALISSTDAPAMQ